ncbi:MULTISPECIES: 3-oxoacyl-[acyl-carrier-protein] synthase III C-terminal domain-containing protein [Okeania]|uniref:Beta-ketoacyl-ACP reductase n=1 Tax=Okeania hirsuta TaxID=1458930 RepID=A0A3N6PHV2_9CYAN|nr:MULTISPECIES: 3-oxoacyl-[acyl-carrier-protein] synthase III C-terminal domain-containing protein [Okeania]NET76531.1 beta-ketoacyl-ACP reductase [Okeania sp. SIO1F9]RQH23272.1 beta-ketoacyl-ACP reductase [Okeania hirsuta]RQH36670.1 beta-ketoacyl-ACP reductase [Okeania hirsuta]
MTSEAIAKLADIPLWVLTEKIGMEKKSIAAEDEHPSDMGIKAAISAINKAQIQPEEIDLIAYCGVGDYDYRFWSPAAKIQGIIGAENAHAFEVRNFCNSGNLGIHICRNMLLADSSLNYALVVCSDKLSQLLNYSDKNINSILFFADGAAAALLKKGESSNKILSYHGMTDGKLADFIRVPLGGTKLPVKDENIDLELNYVKVEDREKLDEILSDICLKNYKKVIIAALQKSGFSIEEIDFLFTNQIKKSLLSSIFESLKLSKKNTFISLKESGHLGATDTLFGLAKTIESEKIKPGNLVVLASSAAGFSWGATVIKY